MDLELLSMHVCEIAHDLLARDQAIAWSKQDDSKSWMFHRPLGSGKNVYCRHKEAYKRQKSSQCLTKEFFNAQLLKHLVDAHEGLADAREPHSAR